MNTIVRNDFTGYVATIKHKGEAPSASCLKKHLRKSKAPDCKSATYFTREDGARVYLDEIQDNGVFIDTHLIFGTGQASSL